MKKKGMLISTIVMVVVLVASLTTATYAWFMNTGSATVKDIEFKVTSASDLVIGVSANNTYVASPTNDNFYSDGTTYTASTNTWTGDTLGLGMSVDTGLDLSSMTKAVYSFTRSGEEGSYTYAQTAYTKGSGQAVTTGLARSTGNYLMKANGNGNKVDASSLEEAVANTDYLDVVFGVSANNGNVLAFGCLITVDNAGLKTTLGMNAALHVIFSTDGEHYTELDLYGTDSNSTVCSTMTVPTMPSATIAGNSVDYTSSVEGFTYAPGDANLFIPLYTAENATAFAPVDASGIKQLHIIIYMCGPDGDCITSAQGVGATIKIEFVAINKTAYDAAIA